MLSQIHHLELIKLVHPPSILNVWIRITEAREIDDGPLKEPGECFIGCTHE